MNRIGDATARYEVARTVLLGVLTVIVVVLLALTLTQARANGRQQDAIAALLALSAEQRAEVAAQGEAAERRADLLASRMQRSMDAHDAAVTRRLQQIATEVGRVQAVPRTIILTPEPRIVVRRMTREVARPQTPAPTKRKGKR